MDSSKRQHSYIWVDETKMTVLKTRVKRDDRDNPVSLEVRTDVFGQMDHFAFREIYRVKISDEEIYQAEFTMRSKDHRYENWGFRIIDGITGC